MVVISNNADLASAKICEIASRFNLDHILNNTKGSNRSLRTVLDQFPVITKQGLVQFREDNAESYLEEALLFAETSGTTGVPLQIPRTKFDLVSGVANYWLAYKRYLSPGRDRVAFFHPSFLSPLRDLTVRTLQDHDIGIMTVFPIPNLYTYDRIHAALVNNRVTTLMSSPSSIHQILYNFYMLGLTFPSSIERIFVTGEYFSRSQANNIKRLIGRDLEIVPIVYGANEIGMMMYGDADLTYQGFTADFVFESVPIPDYSEHISALPLGAHLGELLVTSLTRSAMPIIRYATKDLFVFTPAVNGSWRFNHVGRSENLPLNLRTRNLIDDAMYSLDHPVFHFKIQLSTEGSGLAVQVLQSEKGANSVSSIIERLGQIVPDQPIAIENEYAGGFRLGECVSKISRFAVAACP
ncbi:MULTISPECIES: hypothetical protein [Agrobacterium]|uniref:hypothetical protein n=1 Tax=Agrobacterium TaxID=357 RepID=UPI0009BA76D5|nr:MULTISPECIES: hypothetical protein [Agrobacterium]QCL77429.1 hypothetical protein CFBP5499_28670 [Agrobacterium tumefaciens]CUX72243.1 putative Coenzyme F390 synthetase-like protein [Agrobacterium sp. NCPPB 925]